MTIVQLLGPSTGGIRRTVAALTDALRRDGHRVLTAGPAGVLEPLLTTDATVAVPAGLDPIALVRAARRLRRLVGRGDLVHAHGLKAGWVVFVSGRRPWVLTIHNVVLPGSVAARLTRRLERIVVGRADAVIATSSEIELNFAPVAKRISTIRPVHAVGQASRPAADVRRELGISSDEPMVVCVARLHAQKGIDVALDAWALGVDARLVIVGEGPAGGELVACRDRLGLTERVTFTGARDDVADLIAAADVVLIPSRWESGPLVLLEALAAARPVVTTRVGFVEEVVGSGLDAAAVVVDASDRPAELADAVRALLEDSVRRERLAAGGPAAAAPFLDQQRMLLATLAVYERVGR